MAEAIWSVLNEGLSLSQVQGVLGPLLSILQVVLMYKGEQRTFFFALGGNFFLTGPGIFLTAPPIFAFYLER